MSADPTRPYSCVLWDLDGTIVDSAAGILESLRWTYQQLGMPVPGDDELIHWVGPPIMDSFRDLAKLDPEESARALAIYREHYIVNGAVHSPLFPGIAAVVREVHAAGLPSSLATSKPEIPATLILEKAGLVDALDVITGASADEVRSAKKDVVAEALVRLAALGFDVSRPVMVGDRIHDVEGAAANGVPTIAVLWGYGTDAERTDTVALAATPTDLIPLLLG
ncbi:HAD hydrolase-like protein [Galbitalea sp. SE-J8]|uniref:HAD hydrolase-like protein n=1 Tax=Galbitalea sp. SE-J8 TaxID=3054952 RepID=UPI00259D0E67|nr:HAD hydrolase-like protein [Galbitalea sp. SE-J8]MDM4763302.1 HAD hydrolase-like protein [Galbitalea sp. SE-J8]